MKNAVCFLSVCVVLTIGLFGCNGGSSSSPTFPMVLIEQSVTVAAGGGGADVVFSGSNGQIIRITMKAATNSMEPYGYLTNPDGATGEYYPPLGSAQNGQSSAEVTLTQTGSYNLTVYDGSNQGGIIVVTIERLS